MASTNAILRKRWKEHDPEKYQQYLEREKERSKRRRQAKKEKCAEEVHTRAVVEERERVRLQNRERAKRYRAKRAAEKGRQTRTSVAALEKESGKSQGCKRRCDMGLEERRQHDNRVKRDYIQKLSNQKKAAIRRKNRERMKARRQKQKEEGEKKLGDASTNEQIKKLPKRLLNFGSQIKQCIKEKTKTSDQYAGLVLNLATPRTPEKRKALLEVFKSSNSAKRFFKSEPVGAIKRKRERKRVTLLRKRNKLVDQRVQVFYASIEVARVLPHKRYATKMGPAYAMIVTMRGAYRMFKDKYPELEISYSKFCQLRPKNVRKLGSVNVETCLCLYCQNLRYKIDALNRQPELDEKLPNEGRLLDIILCEKSGKWHNIKCVRGQCEKCCRFLEPIKQRCSNIINNSLRWTHWERRSQDGQTRLDVYPKSGTVSALLEEMEKDLLQPIKGVNFAEHIFNAHWQHNQYRQLINTLMPGEVLLVEDFAENRKATYDAEVKSAHFSKRQIMLHPVVAYYKNEEYQLVRHALMFLSDDIAHDFHMVNHITLATLKHLKMETVLQAAYIFSDGCASQYKGKGTFADLSLMSGLKVQRAFFGSEHGKGEADGETGVLSQKMSSAVKGGTNFRNAADIFSWASAELTKGTGLSRRTFFLVKNGEVNRDRPQTDIATVPGTRKMHQVERVGDYILQSRHLACFCCACRASNTALCINGHIVGHFTPHKLKRL